VHGTGGSHELWTENTATVNWVRGHQYAVSAKAWDIAGNVDVIFSTYTFTFDDEPSISSITYPTGDHISSLAIISGTADDAISPLSTVQLEIKRQDNWYWHSDTTDWRASAEQMNANLVGNNWMLVLCFLPGKTVFNIHFGCM